MKVKRRMQIMAVLPLVLAIIIGLILAWMTLNVKDIVLQLRAANAITRDVFLLDMVTHEYIKKPALESRARWLTIHDRINKTITREIVASPGEQKIFRDISQTLERSKAAFMDLSAQLTRGAPSGTQSVLNLQSRLRLDSLAIVDEALFLAAKTHDQVIAIQMASFYMIIGVSSVLAILLLVIAVLISRRIDKGLAVLHDGTFHVARGKLGYQVKADNQDELGELAAAFNTMSRELKKDQDTIHAEMAAREKIADSLAKSNIQLSDALTKLKRAQAEVIQQERLKVLKQMADGILHDIYDAMMPVLGYSELLLRFPEEINTQNGRQQIQAIHDAVSRSISVAKHLSEYFYPTKKDNAAPINLKQMLESALSSILPPHKETSSRITVKMELDDIPEFNSIEADISEALIHVITNAVEAMEETGTLKIRARTEAGAVLVEVSDTGPGMTPEISRRCLEPFYSTKGRDHSGMGLTITQGAIARCQGALKIESQPGKGTSVTIKIPLLQPKTVPAIVENEKPLSPGRKLRVLVVDDEECIRNLLIKALNSMGYEAETAPDGPAAIEMFRAAAFDVVIVDMAMPVMDGHEVAAAVKKIRPRAPVIMLTGFGDALKERGEKLADVDFLLSKPMPLGDLKNAITCVMMQAEGKK
jgi:signal transduction histidine kinase/ActR/RegA family two-component response regulator